MMNTQQDDQKSNMDNASEQPLSVGKTLREAREQLGLTVNDVANRIKFAPKQIEWLEADDYVRLPEAAFVRGFVRSYARLLELDPARLISGLPSSHMQTSSTQEVRSVEIPLPSAFSARRHNIIWLAAALVVAVSLAIFERFHDRAPQVAEPVAKTTAESSAVANTNVEPLELPNVTAESESVQLPAQVKPAVAVSQPAARTAPAAAPQAAVRTAPAPVPQQPEPSKALKTAPVPLPLQSLPRKAAPAVQLPADTAAPGPASAEPKVNSESNASEHKLRLELDEDAWVEVKDGNDKILISKMHSAGSLVRVTGKAPLLVTIGNARAVRLFDNGKKINLERHTTAEVARVKLD